jgi:hypothetical protein
MPLTHVPYEIHEYDGTKSHPNDMTSDTHEPLVRLKFEHTEVVKKTETPLRRETRRSARPSMTAQAEHRS